MERRGFFKALAGLPFVGALFVQDEPEPDPQVTKTIVGKKWERAEWISTTTGSYTTKDGQSFTVHVDPLCPPNTIYGYNKDSALNNFDQFQTLLRENMGKAIKDIAKEA